MKKLNKVTVVGIELELEPFIDEAFIQGAFTNLQSVAECIVPIAHAHINNFIFTAYYFNFDELARQAELQLQYFKGIKEVDKLFDYRNHDDYKRLRQVLVRGLSSRKCPDVVVNALHEFI